MYIVHGASTMFPAHTNMCAYTYTHTSICVRIYLHATEGPAAVLIIYVHTCINVYARIYSYHIRAYMHARICSCIYACTYMIRTAGGSSCVYTHRLTYSHTHICTCNMGTTASKALYMIYFLSPYIIYMECNTCMEHILAYAHLHMCMERILA